MTATIEDPATPEPSNDHAHASHDDHSHGDHGHGGGGLIQDGPSLIDAPPAVLPRRRNVQIGSALLTAATVMYFGGLFGVYLSERSDHLGRNELLPDAASPWIPADVRVELTAPTMITWTLLLSCVTMQWAAYAFKRNDRRHGLIGLAVTTMFGLAVLNHVVFQWNQLGIVVDDISGSTAPPLLYAITTSHFAMVLIAVIFLFFVSFRTLSGATTSQHVDGVQAAAVFWYAMVGIYFIMWILVFITK